MNSNSPTPTPPPPGPASSSSLFGGVFFSSPYTQADMIVAIVSLALFVLYHLYYAYQVLRRPELTTLGMNIDVRRKWVRGSPTKGLELVERRGRSREERNHDKEK